LGLCGAFQVCLALGEKAPRCRLPGGKKEKAKGKEGFLKN
jgi:hypothetical protein